MRIFSRLRQGSRSRSRPQGPASHTSPTMNTIAIDEKGTQFSYLDSGAPAQGASYATIVAVHGMGFAAGVFKRVIAQSPKSNIRFIAVVRRGYPGSTPFSEAEAAAGTSGTDDEKMAYVNARGLELAVLVDKLIQGLKLCPISENGEGGVAVLGWSSGNTWSISCIANMDQLAPESRARMTAHIRAHIIYDPPSVCLGLPLPPKLWSPLIDTTLPEDKRVSFYTPWITAYFDHGDLSTRNIDEINYYCPNVRRAPSIYNMSTDDLKEFLVESATWPESALMVATQSQENSIYRKACYSKIIKDLLPKMKTSVLVGEATSSFALNGMFSMQDDNEKESGELQFDLVPDANHFMHWDEPEKALKAYARVL